MKKTAVLCILLLTGCGYLEPGLPAYEKPETIHANTVSESVPEKAAEELTPPSLSDDFMSKYLDVNEFEGLKQRTIDGMRNTESMADMTEGEIALWNEIIRYADINQFTAEELEQRKAELNAALDRLASEQHMTTEEFLRNGDFGINLEEARDLLDRQAEKYTEIFQKYEQGGGLPSDESENTPN